MVDSTNDGGAPSPQSLVGLAWATLRRQNPQNSPDRPRSRNYAPALILLAVTPLLTTVAAQGLAVVLDHHNAALEAAAGPRIRQSTDARNVTLAKVAIAPLMERLTITDLVARLAATLPEGTYLHAAGVDAGGEVRVEVDCIDPEILRSALRQDSLLARLRMVGQSPAPTGVRVALAAHEP